MEAVLRAEKFQDISLDDLFFDTLKADYGGFKEWFTSKADKEAFTFRAYDGSLDGFLYLKEESGEVTDVEPHLPFAHRLKIGTFKINPHGTRLGERFMKRAFDTAISSGAAELYVTVFERHAALVQLFERYGFLKVGVKSSSSGEESVYQRLLSHTVGDVVRDYPRIPFQKDRHFVLALYPQWHSRLLPDSLLKTESTSILEDVSHTNSIHKIYLAAMRGIDQLKCGDTLLIYRTADGGSGYRTSVVTSLCVVEQLTHIDNFSDEGAFMAFCEPYSIFEPDELRAFYHHRKYPWVIRFTYNLAFTKRPNRQALLEDVGLQASMYWGFFQISTGQLRQILKLSGDYEKTRSLVYSS